MGILGNPVLLGSPPLKQTGVSMASVNAQFAVNMPLIQTGSGTPSFVNVRPITGRTGMNLTYSGRNILPYPYYSGSPVTVNSVTFTINSDGTISTSGTATGGDATYYLAHTSNGLCLPAGDYRLKGGLSQTCFLWISGGGISGEAEDTGSGADVTITNSANAVSIGITIESGTSAEGLTFSPMFVPAAADETFVTPKGLTVYVYDWSSDVTVAEGSLNVLTGVLTVDRIRVDLGSLTYSLRSYGYFRGTLPSGHTYRSYTTGGNNPADCYPSAYPDSGALADIPDKTITTNRGLVGANYIAIKDSDYTTEAAIKTALQGHYASVSVRNETYQLTPGRLAVTPGDNFIWSDTGPVTLVLAK